MPQVQPEIPLFKIIGVPVHVLSIADTLKWMFLRIESSKLGGTICFTNAYSVVLSQKDPVLRKALRHASLSVPDGMPLAWLGRLRKFPLKRRVYGPELFLEFCQQSQRNGYRHFFYGGHPGIPEKMVQVLKSSFPGIQIAGTLSPPFRALTLDEDEEIVKMINLAGPDVCWVGLGAPKQEIWMMQHRDRLRVPVLAGVGAAFDFVAGRVKQAPFWMREHGMEWLYRFFQEPRRLWRRYLICNLLFLYYVFLEQTGLKEFDDA